MSTPINRQFWNLVAERIESEPAAIVSGREQIRHWRGRRPEAASDPYWRRWEGLIEQGPAAVVAALREPGEVADTLRSCAPFLGLVSPRERASLYRAASAKPAQRGQPLH